MTETSPSLPPGLDLLWGRRARGRRGPKPGLSLDAIVGAAVAVADAEGLEAVSMARVAAQLGFTPMSLYRYVRGKDELLQLMWNASAQGAEELVLAGRGWREQLRNWSLLQWEMLGRHPWLTQMPLAAPPLAPASLTFVERGLAALDGTELADADKLRVIGILSSYTLSEAGMAHDAARAAATSAPQWTFEGLLRELVEEADYPRLHRIAWSGGAGDTPAGVEADDEFRFGLETILDGVAALITKAKVASGKGKGRRSGG